ncbi:BON domain-containing protein [Roseiarcus sp.]|uniref:BON domain-containing protein n=1 Tax=Roseiarcus sp. TaxID=1969460 RepID=UPI003F9C7AC4
MRSDNEIKRDVEDEIRWSVDADATDIAVRVTNGTVEIAGFVKRFRDKFDAEASAKRVSGVVGLANEIEVRLPRFDQRPDPDIAHDAAAAIKFWAPAATSIKASVQNGWVASPSGSSRSKTLRTRCAD